MRGRDLIIAEPTAGCELGHSDGQGTGAAKRRCIKRSSQDAIRGLLAKDVVNPPGQTDDSCQPLHVQSMPWPVASVAE